MIRYRPLRIQHGAAMLEFAFVLPFLLALIIGVIYYGYVYTLYAALTHAAKQGAEIAVAIEPADYDSSADYKTAVRSAVQQSVSNSLQWLPASVPDNPPVVVCFSDEDCANGDSGTRISVTMTLSGSQSPLLPQVSLPLVGAVPPLPPELTGVAEVVL